MVSVWSGGVRYQLTRRKPPTATDQRRPQPADRRDADDEQQEQQQGTRRRHLIASLGEHPGEEWRPDRTESEPQRHASARKRARPAQLRLGGGVRLGAGLTADDVHVEAHSREPDHGADDRPVDELAPARAFLGAEHDLRGVESASRLDQRLADVGAGHLAVAAAQALHQAALLFEQTGGRRRQAGLRAHVHRDQVGVETLGHARRAAHEPVAVRRPREGDQDPLARLPGLRDAVADAVLGEAFLDPVGDPQKRELAQRSQVAGAEVVAEGGVDALGGVDVAAREPSPDRLDGEVDELQLVGAAHDLVRDGLALHDAGDLLYHVVEGLEMLDVEVGDHADPRVEQLLDVLPALLVAAPRHVGVREFVDERQLRTTREERVEVHLLEGRVPIRDGRPGHDLELADLVGGPLPAVRLDEAHHDVLAARPAAATLVQHRVGLADAGSGAEVDPQRAAAHAALR